MSIIIVGGGVTGLTLALTISYRTAGKLPVHLIESVIPKDTYHSETDIRTIVLAHGTCQQLEYTGIWQMLVNSAIPIHSVHISNQGHIGFITFKAEDYCISALGQVFTLRNIKLRLFKLLNTVPGVILHCPAQIINLIRNEKTVSLKLDNGDMLNGQLLVIADGSHSKLAKQCGFKFKKRSYDQVALVSNITTKVNSEGKAWKRFTKDGSLTILPTSNCCQALVWCQKEKYINEIMLWSNDRFCAELQNIFGWRLGHIIHSEYRTIYPLTLIIANSSISHRTVLIGNAAQTLHPIAAQGLNLGLRDVINLAKIITKVWSKRQDYGIFSVLDCYQSSRQQDRLATINITDNLIRIFSSQCLPLTIGRNLGLMTMGFLTPAHKLIMRHLLGWMTR